MTVYSTRQEYSALSDRVLFALGRPGDTLKPTYNSPRETHTAGKVTRRRNRQPVIDRNDPTLRRR